MLVCFNSYPVEMKKILSKKGETERPFRIQDRSGERCLTVKKFWYTPSTQQKTAYF